MGQGNAALVLGSGRKAVARMAHCVSIATSVLRAKSSREKKNKIEQIRLGLATPKGSGGMVQDSGFFLN